MRGRNDSVQSVTILRGVAALGVCIVHFHVANQVIYSQPVERLLFMGQLGVNIFFVISGFILPYSLYKKNYKLSAFPRFLLKRSIRIDPPYWAAIALLFIAGYHPISKLQPQPVLLHLFYLVPFIKGQEWYISVFWTLATEFQYYLLLGLLFPLLMKLKPLLSVCLVLFASAVCVFMDFSIRELIFKSLHDFAVGYIVFLFFVNKLSRRNAIIILAVFCAFLALKVSIITGAVPAATALFIMFFKAKTPRFILFLGEISFSLYLIHNLIYWTYLNFIKAYISNVFILGVTSIALAIVAAYVFNSLIEKTALNLSKKIRLSSDNGI